MLNGVSQNGNKYGNKWELEMQKCHYEVLGVAKDADEKVIKKAYRRMAMKYHPDRNPDDADAAEKFQEAKDANEILTDAALRQAYDEGGHDAVAVIRDGEPGVARPTYSYEDVESEVLDDDYDPFESILNQKANPTKRTAENSGGGTSDREARREERRRRRQEQRDNSSFANSFAESGRSKEAAPEAEPAKPQAPATVTVETATLQEAIEKLQAAGETRLARKLNASINKAKTNSMKM